MNKMIQYLIYSFCLCFFLQSAARLQFEADFLTAINIHAVSLKDPNSFYKQTWIVMPNGGLSLDFNFEKTKYDYINLDYIGSNGKLYKYDFRKELSLLINNSLIKICKDNTIDLKYQDATRATWNFVRKFKGITTPFLR